MSKLGGSSRPSTTVRTIRQHNLDQVRKQAYQVVDVCSPNSIDNVHNGLYGKDDNEKSRHCQFWLCDRLTRSWYDTCVVTTYALIGDPLQIQSTLRTSKLVVGGGHWTRIIHF